MDLKDVLMNSEGALPALSSGTASAQPSLPSISVTNTDVGKFAASGILSLLGMYYLASGKKQNDVQKLILGAALSIGALFLF